MAPVEAGAACLEGTAGLLIRGIGCLEGTAGPLTFGAEGLAAALVAACVSEWLSVAEG